MTDLGTLYTVGYQAVQTPERLGQLLAGKAERVLDVRLRRFSGLHAFSSGTEQTIRALGMDYEWVSGLGNARYQTGGIQLVRPEDVAIPETDLRAGRSVALMCACSKAEHCHRRTIADMLVKRLPELQVVDL